jgi:hypothetical protein
VVDTTLGSIISAANTSVTGNAFGPGGPGSSGDNGSKFVTGGGSRSGKVSVAACK